MEESKILQIKDFLIDKIDPDFVILFGSQATGQTHPDSDVDIAFFKQGHEFTAYDIFIMAGELASIIKIDIDLIDLSEASTVFKMQIFSNYKNIHVTCQEELDQYTVTSLNMYADLNIERKEILKDIIERGSVYGDKN